MSRLMTFDELEVGESFATTGSTVWIKQSSRTARLSGSKQWFYFSKTEAVRLLSHRPPARSKE